MIKTGEAIKPSMISWMHQLLWRKCRWPSVKLKREKQAASTWYPSNFTNMAKKSCTNSILAVLNFVLTRGDYPQIGADRVITPIYKVGKMSEPENYRKITLLSSFGKLFDSVMNNRLSFVKEALRLEKPFQNRFKQGAQSTDNLFILNSVIDK